MGGPSGYSLSQPGVMMSHSGRGPYEYTRLVPGGRGRGKGEGPWGDRHPHGRRSIDEELDCFNEEDENHENGREKVREREREGGRGRGREREGEGGRGGARKKEIIAIT